MLAPPKGRTSGGVKGDPNTDPHKVFGRLELSQKYLEVMFYSGSEKYCEQDGEGFLFFIGFSWIVTGGECWHVTIWVQKPAISWMNISIYRPFIGVITPSIISRGPPCRLPESKMWSFFCADMWYSPSSLWGWTLRMQGTCVSCSPYVGLEF